ncbi:polyamine ABC transporter substrate-binding protein [Dongia sp.]|uniref:polyamine ABC transporter substrate-binding protein n=1 Tax=Dongia sp. TaxID=1977262 RepID=UPI0035AFA208
MPTPKIAAVAFISALLLAACGEEQKAAESEQAPATTEQAAAEPAVPAAEPATAPATTTETASTPAAAAGSGGKVNIYNWSDYIDESTIPAFEAATGITVQYDVYDSNEMLEAKLMAGGTGYDLVHPSAAFLGRQIMAGIYQPLDTSKLKNYKNLDPKIMEVLEAYDPGHKFAVPWFWGTTGIGYNVAEVNKRMPDAPVNSLDIVFKPELAQKFADCGISMLDAPSEILQIALNYLGKKPDTASPEDYAEAEKLLLAVRPYVKYFHSSSYINDIANGSICLAIGWSGDFSIAGARAEEAKNGIEIAYSIPKEGTIIWVDTMAIPADAANVDQALAWIDFNLDANVAATNANYVAYGSPVAAALPLIDKALLDDPNTYPPEDVKAKLFPDKVAGAEVERLRTRTWTKIKTGQ